MGLSNPTTRVITTSLVTANNNHDDAFTVTMIAGPTSPVASSNIYVGIIGAVDFQENIDNINNSHLPAMVGWTKYSSPNGAKSLLQLGVEGKVECFTPGELTTSYAVDGQFINHAGGFLRNAFAFNAEILQNDGVISNFAAFRMGDHTFLPTQPVLKQFMRCDDPNAPSYIQSQVYCSYGYKNIFANGAFFGEVAPAHHPGYVAGRFYSGAPGAASPLTPVNLTAGSIYCKAFQVASRHTFTKIGVTCTTGQAASNTRLGIYYCNNGQPIGVPIFDSGNISSAGAGALEAVLNKQLEAGTYIAVVQTSTTNVAINFITDYSVANTWGATTATGEESIPVITGGAYGVLPANPVINSYNTSPTNYLAPAIYMIA